jgi:hypothetical protein
MTLQTILPLSRLGQTSHVSDFLLDLMSDLLNSFLRGCSPSPTMKNPLAPSESDSSATGGLDLLWLPEQLGCDQLYPLRHPGLPSPACRAHVQVVSRLQCQLELGLMGGGQCLI